MTCQHCDPTADGGVAVAVRVTSYERYSADCRSLATDPTTQAGSGRQYANQGHCAPLHQDGNDA